MDDANESEDNVSSETEPSIKCALNPRRTSRLRVENYTSGSICSLSNGVGGKGTLDFGSAMQLNTNVAHVDLIMKMTQTESRLPSGQHDRSEGRTLKEIH